MAEPRTLTRSQEDLVLAERCVAEASRQLDAEGQRIYGTLCHKFPVLVRTCGLCQALAFSQEKSAKDGSRAKAHGLLLKHVGQLLGEPNGDPLARVREGDVLKYLHDTWRVLDAWIYFKRFAVSILNVEPGDAPDE